jgi:hypothetical protein
VLLPGQAWQALTVVVSAPPPPCRKAPLSSRGRGFIQSGARRLLGSSSTNGGAASSSTGVLYSEPVVHPRHPYFKLLRLYLEVYLPRPGGLRLGVGAGASGAGGLGSTAGGAAGGGGGLLGSSMSPLAGLTANTAFAGEWHMYICREAYVHVAVVPGLT